MDIRPPRWADRFLRWYCNPDLLEEIQGDAYELYYDRLENNGKRYANFKFVWDVFRFLRLSNIRRSSWNAPEGSWRFAVRFAWRNSINNPLNFVIKILGISISFGYALTLMVIAFNELKFDHYQINAARIYRIGSVIKFSGNTTNYAVSPLPLAYALQESIPEVEGSMRFMAEEYPVIKREDNFFTDMRVLAVDSNYLRILTYDYLSGGRTALDGPNQIVLTESLAKKIFGDTDPIGQSLTYNNNFLVEVTGIVKDPAHPSHLKADALISWDTFDQWDSWGNLNAYSYIQLKENASIDKVKKKIHPALKELDELIADEYKGSFEPIIENIQDIHLSPELDEDIAIKGSSSYAYLLVTISILFSLLGIVNYVNLVSAELTKDSKKIGLFTIFGGSRLTYKKTLLSQCILYLGIALLLTIGIVVINLWLARIYLGKEIDYSLLREPVLLGFSTLLFALTLLSVYLSSSIYLNVNTVVNTLKGNLNFKKSGLSIRQFFVSVQFSFSIVMIALIMVLVQQFYFLKSKDKGFNDENVLVIKLHPERLQHLDVFKDALLKQSGITAVAGSSYYPGVIETKFMFSMESDKGMKKRITPVIFCGADYLDIISAKIIQGRKLDGKRLNDYQAAYIINEEAAREFGWNEPLGKKIVGPVGANDESDRSGVVVGVVKDFNYASLYSKIDPLIIILRGNTRYFYVKMQGADVASLVSKVESAYKEQFSDTPFEWEFLDSKYKSLYMRDYDSQIIFQLGMIISIFISCLGIFSVSALMASLRQKETGIRKVVGATSFQLFVLHVKKFSKLFIISLLIAWPVIGYLSTYWLNSFAYRIDLGLSYYVIPATIAFLIVLITAGYHGIKSTRLNPVNALKCE